MSSTSRNQPPVLIAGAGPAGLTTAITLANQGVECLLVERRPSLSAHPRATGVTTRTMELLRSFGLEAAVRAGGAEVEWLELFCETLALAADGSTVPIGVPTREQAAMVSPTGPACVPQDHLEPVMLRHLRSLGPASVLLGTEVTGVTSGPDGVRAVLRPTDGGPSRTVQARYLVAADGAHSPTRAALGIPMLGPDDLATAVSVLFRAPLWELLGEHRYGLYAVTHPGAEGGIFLPAGADDRWIFGVLPEPGRLTTDALDERRLAGLIRHGIGVAGLAPRIEGMGSFTFAAQIAPRFRHHSAFLVGDAAHRVTPRGGTGMNTAIHDGYDLGWKLAWVLRGWAGAGLLDSYEAERRPVVEHNLARSADPDGTARDAAEELHADLGGRLPHLWVPTGAGHVSTLDLLGPGLTLFTGPRSRPWDVAAAGLGGSLPVEVHSLDAVTARALGSAATARCWPGRTACRPAGGRRPPRPGRRCAPRSGRSPAAPPGPSGPRSWPRWSRSPERALQAGLEDHVPGGKHQQKQDQHQPDPPGPAPQLGPGQPADLHHRGQHVHEHQPVRERGDGHRRALHRYWFQYKDRVELKLAMRYALVS